MMIYFQHVGERGGERDFPRTIGTQSAGLKQFAAEDLAPMMADLPDGERQRILNRLTQERAFQVWGFPAPASRVLRRLCADDWILLLDTDRPGGLIVYGGRVLTRPDRPLPSMSQRLWGEGRFPLIVFLHGVLATYDWETMRETLGYSPDWRLSGMTYRVVEDRLVRSKYQNEAGLLRAVLGVSV